MMTRPDKVYQFRSTVSPLRSDINSEFYLQNFFKFHDFFFTSKSNGNRTITLDHRLLRRFHSRRNRPISFSILIFLLLLPLPKPLLPFAFPSHRRRQPPGRARRRRWRRPSQGHGQQPRPGNRPRLRQTRLDMVVDGLVLHGPLRRRFGHERVAEGLD